VAIIQMWPENQGLRNSITFDGRTYSSIPGVSTPVPDSDVAVLQANGWTTFSMTGGKTTITMLSPAKAVYSQITINGHTYSTTPGVSIEAPLFDAATLQANGWTLVQLTGVTLQPLTLSAAAFRVGDPQGTVVGSILGASSGSTIAFNSLGMAGALQIAGTSLQVGPTPSGSPSTVTFNLVETLTGATNTPNQTNGFSVSELAAIPVNTVVPTITGTAQVGQTLTASPGAWTNTPASYTYQWNRAGTPIGGATASTYVPVAGDIGNTLTVAVVARNSGGSSTPATSAATSAVTAAASGVPANTVLPAISGTPQVGQTLTATNGTWTNSPTSFTYQWNRAGTAIGGATASTYVPVSADVGNTLTVSVVATNSGGSSSAAISAASAAVIPAGAVPMNTGLPALSGTAQNGQTLAATNGTWTNSPTSFTYQWKSAGVNATGAGATTANYTCNAADVGNTITCAVTAINESGSSTPAISAPTAAVIDIIPGFVALPVVSGTPQVGQTLTGTNGTWTHNPTSYGYQWGNTIQGGIGGATASTYVPVVGDIGHMINISVIATNTGGSAPSVTSSAAGPIIAAGSVPVNTVLPTLAGTAQVGQTLSATNGTWTNSPTSFTYQWNRAGKPIGGATASTYVPVSADVGNTVTISITATNSSGSSTPATSAATSSVIDIIPTNLALPAISGTARVGQTLTATLGTWSHSPTSFWHQWANSNGLIPGATQLTYVPTSADVGLILEIFVVATNSGGTSAVVNSAPTAAVIDIIPTNSAVPTISGTARVGQTLTRQPEPGRTIQPPSPINGIARGRRSGGQRLPPTSRCPRMSATR
jgi:hypothetical protein